MAMEVLKVETEIETCCVCGSAGELTSPEEYDASVAPMQVPLRTMLMHINNNKVVPEGRFCGGCITRAVDAYEFSTALNSQGAPSLSDKIRALRRRLHELTQKIDVFIVVGGPGAGAAASYSEDDIIMVEKDALAAAAAADEEDLDHARNTKGDTVYQCSVCPMSFQRASELRAHVYVHPSDARHSCWSCGAQFASRTELRAHAAAEHRAPPVAATRCPLCQDTFNTQAELRAHEGVCAARCPACGAECASRAALREHAVTSHRPPAPPPYLCAACFLTFPERHLYSAHQLRHRQARQFVCGYGECVLRFGARDSLLAHIRKAHSGALPAPAPAPPAPGALPAAPAGPGPGAGSPNACHLCDRKFASGGALKRHLRAHERQQLVADVKEDTEPEMEIEEGETVEQVMRYIAEGEGGEDGVGKEEGEEDGEVEYLEVETLDDAEYILQD